MHLHSALMCVFQLMLRQVFNKSLFIIKQSLRIMRSSQYGIWLLRIILSDVLSEG